MAKESVSGEKNNIFVVLAIAVLLISLISLGITLNKTNEFKQKLTGYATSVTGIVNVTIVTALSINMVNSTIWWGDGYVNATNCKNATLYTNSSYSVGNVSVANGLTCGNWSGSTGYGGNPVYGMVIINNGNQNITVNMTNGFNATGFLGSSPNDYGVAYQYNVSNYDTSACNNTAAKWHNNVWTNVNSSTLGAAAPNTLCQNLGFAGGISRINLDILLRIPSDSSKRGSSLTDTLTISAAACPGC